MKHYRLSRQTQKRLMSMKGEDKSITIQIALHSERETSTHTEVRYLLNWITASSPNWGGELFLSL